MKESLANNTCEMRVTELETKVAFQEYLLQQLNEVVIQQQAQLEHLELRIKLLHQKEASTDNTMNHPEKPPHY